MKFEDYVTNCRYKHFIKNLTLLYSRVCKKNKINICLKMMALCESIIPYLLKKFNKSGKNFHKFIFKMENGIVKTFHEKQMSIICKNKII